VQKIKHIMHVIKVFSSPPLDAIPGTANFVNGKELIIGGRD